MEVFWIYNLGRNLITGTSGSQHAVFWRIPGIRITGLNHKVTYYTVKQQTVIIVFLNQFYKIVPVLWSPVVKFDSNVAGSGLDKYLCLFFG